jgi:electron transfer flavoprotein beta subunit
MSIAPSAQVNVAVLIAGIADPKWPLDAKQPRILSPFDESALEVALKLRDASPASIVSVAVLGDAADEPLVRSVASHRPDRLLRVEAAEGSGWDLRSRALLLAQVLREVFENQDLILTGREFGDRDDGAVPACLAAILGCPYVALVREVVTENGALAAVRERAGFEERIEHVGPLLASVTNDRSNRLRHALLKNVMNAKRMSIEARRLEEPAARVTLEASAPAAAPARAASCRMVEVEALAGYLREWHQPP